REHLDQSIVLALRGREVDLMQETVLCVVERAAERRTRPLDQDLA
ncbi:MAG: hypothetical protein QOH74_439, partial [Gaiellales bacterium]|nr:hypothetical protein [Gaiellales bacterium]